MWSSSPWLTRAASMERIPLDFKKGSSRSSPRRFSLVLPPSTKITDCAATFRPPGTVPSCPGPAPALSCSGPAPALSSPAIANLPPSLTITMPSPCPTSRKVTKQPFCAGGRRHRKQHRLPADNNSTFHQLCRLCHTRAIQAPGNGRICSYSFLAIPRSARTIPASSR